MTFLPDTNVFVAWMAHGDERVTRRMGEHRGDLCLSAIVSHELYFGAYKSSHVDRNLRGIEAIGLPLLPFEREDARLAGKIRDDLRRKGTPIGPYDILIAGQALARNITLITANTAEFSRIEGLRLANWMD